MPQSVALFAVHPRREVPFVLSTDRHFTQGAVELNDAAWDASTNTLRGISKGPASSAHNVTVYVPPEYSWNTPHPEYAQDFEGYSVHQPDPHTLCVRPRFDQSNSARWQITFQHA